MKRCRLSVGKLWGMRRMADANGRFKMTAVDQRPPITSVIARHYGTPDAPYEDVARVKSLLVETLQAQSSALLLDPHYAVPRALPLLSPGKGLIVTLEDSIFEERSGGRRSRAIDNWSVNKIKRMGGDAVKVLAWYRPDADPAINLQQQDFVKRIGEVCARFDIPFLLELLVYPLAADAEQTTEYVEMSSKRADHVLASVEEFAGSDYGVDVFKLESPVAAGEVPGVGNDGWEAVQRLFDELGRLAGRPWVMLSAGAGKREFKHILTHAYRAGASGYLAGRAIWQDAFAHYPDWVRMHSVLCGDAAGYMRELNGLTDEAARPWHEHACFDGDGLALIPADAGFRTAYGEM